MAEPGPAARRADQLLFAISDAEGNPDDAGGVHGLDLAWDELTELDEAIRLLAKFARHREGCHCFICRRPSPSEKALLHRILKETETDNDRNATTS